MRRVTLLALLALALPTAAFANSISFANSGTPFSYDTGVIMQQYFQGCFNENGCISTFIAVGSLNTITITSGPLTLIPCEAIFCFSWSSGGSVTVSHHGKVLFRNKLSDGEGYHDDNVISVDDASLLPNSTVTNGGASAFFYLDEPEEGYAAVGGTSVPEPDTLELLELGLLGCGVIGLGRMARQSKLKT